jgi:PTS system nitrogen regulatory IIA component
MELGDLITPEGIVPSLRVRSKKHLLQELSAMAARAVGIDAGTIYEALHQREMLGSTGVGKGIAIPHQRLAGLKSIYCMFAKLDEPVDYESSDGEPVDLVFLLLAPEMAGADHLKALARISRLLREPLATEKLRSSRKKSALYSILTEPLASNAA